MVKLTDVEAKMVFGGEHPWGSDKVPETKVTDPQQLSAENPWDADLKSGHPWDD